MAKFFDGNLSQTAGEITPLLGARTDLAAYANGAKEITNFLVLPQGGIMNRPGTKYMGNGFNGARLIPFVITNDLSYILVLYPGGGMELWNQDGQFDTVLGGHNFQLQYLSQVRYVQSVDVMILFHRSTQPIIVKRLASSTWIVQNFEMKRGPYQDMNSDSFVTATLTNWNIGDQTGTLTLSDTSAGSFVQNSVGSLFLFEFFQPARSVLMTTGSLMDGLFGTITMKSERAFVGTITLSRKGPEETSPVAVSSLKSGGITPQQTYSVFGYSTVEEEFGAEYWLSGDGVGDTGDGTPINVNSSGGIVRYPLAIIGYISPTSVTVTIDDPVIKHFPAPSTLGVSTWAFGSFGGDRGWPGVATFHQERLVLAASIAEPTTMWMSQPSRWDYFETSVPTLDDDSITVTLASEQVNEIRALSSRDDLLIFTAGAEFAAKAGTATDVFTPSSIVVVPTGYRGCWPLEVLEIGPSTLFVQKHGNVVRGLGYKLEQDGYDSSELSVLSSHLFEGAVVKGWAYQQDPWSIVWIATTNGLLGLTFVQEHNVIAWTKHQFINGVPQDVCVLPGDGQDDLFMIIGDNLLMLNHRDDLAWRSGNRMFYDQLGTQYYSYTSAYESMDLEQVQAQGSVQGRFKHVPKMTLRLFRTSTLRAGIITENSSQLDSIVFPNETSPATKSPAFTGDVHLTVPGDTGRTCRIRLQSNGAVPVTVLGMWKEVDMNDDA